MTIGKSAEYVVKYRTRFCLIEGALNSVFSAICVHFENHIEYYVDAKTEYFVNILQIDGTTNSDNSVNFFTQF